MRSGHGAETLGFVFCPRSEECTTVVNPIITPDGSPVQGPLGALAKAAWQVLLIAGLASLALGIVVFVWPRETLLVVGVLFGLYLLVIGIAQLVAAFGSHASTAMRVLAFISGAISVLLGLLCFRSAVQSLLLLALWIGIGWLFRGITQLAAAISDPLMPARGWQAFAGVANTLAGVLLMVWPVGSIAALTVLAGCWLVILGVVEIATAIQVRGRAKQIPSGV
ncbi:HdeD family acid-resistance protein [Kitasatospora sp. SUK 42]|uniref:HdeD family acid-resistance protein n=1 Tax=Kitasatospora sp. SUK 42 TaxID=1588882 RepID=UPI0027E3747A|nr:HdeD family acid-resistance protein [Kitasatospora sp. SUK 42]